MALLLSTSTSISVPTSSNLRPKLSSIGTHPDTVCRLLFTGVDKKSRDKSKYIIHKAPSFVSLSVKSSQSVSKTRKGREVGSNSRKGGGGYGKLLSEGRDEDEKYGQVCPGCGIFMQDEDPNLPGYYKKRSVDHLTIDVEDNEGFLDDEEFGDIEGEVQFGDYIEGTMDSGIDWDLEEWESEVETEDDDLEELDGFSPAGLGYGNITEEILERRKKKRVSKAERKRMAREAARMEKEEVTVCARCYSLRNYGQVKNQVAENLIPDFDFERLITTRLMKPTGNADATVVVMVVDCIDFDGSFPKRAANSLFKALERSKEGLKQSKKLPKLVLVATKVDLLPSQVSPTRLDKWVRHRAKANGAPKLSGVYLVSARKDLGVRNLLAFIKELAGPRGNVWVIGAQNAGKSTLINAFAKKEGVKATKLTEAPVPGTTLGILRIGGVLSAKAKMYDTPGLLHPYLLSMRLNRDEQKMVEIRKELQPRSYRIKPGQTVHLGGLVRLDLNSASVNTIYVTVWASPSVSLHLGKTENADDIWNKHCGIRLQPPISMERVPELGPWKEKQIKASGTSWDLNSIDISVAGFGWLSLGLKGEADLTLWTYDGIEITLREALVLDRSPFLERPGFWLPKAISDAIGNQSKLEAQARKTTQDTLLSEVEVPC
ncbi:PREDICTED: GTP-binding protein BRASSINAZOLE INSENSITIVE PALE GREEN 2, chloroplastic [Ipomoea nil]|uniref:GTP-binding protein BRASSINAZOLE INSENSITIVE PALE GREEN 2, chloroplastic n=1 Tax=Ipomoea nil TaxID=35883 RepID=UPI0009015B66|nr:PREDICTED: GTP-binding protein BRASSINAZOLE INSENSITIVE PALE GREEN 2, chloroplastic [Ipomoea nil]